MAEPTIMAVLVNGRTMLRVGDRGFQAACYGANLWESAQGAPSVFINGKSVHRDANHHCGGVGQLTSLFSWSLVIIAT